MTVEAKLSRGRKTADEGLDMYGEQAMLKEQHIPE